uniref:Uncharacterized protein n=1 Tax=viral metagenome TaxID=1070528 RepID=A0A6M3MGI8_9ZZZZ
MTVRSEQEHDGKIIKCPKCGKKGTVFSRACGKRRNKIPYYYVCHTGKEGKVSNCYIGKEIPKSAFL